jgi:superoxide dismutase
MLEHDYSQLPVVDNEKKPKGIITNNLILRALNYFKADLKSLKVRDAMEEVFPSDIYSHDQEIFDLLGELESKPAVMIVDSEGKLANIITPYDTNEYLRLRSQDFMIVEEIETMIRNFISLVIPNESEISTVIAKVMPSGREQQNIARNIISKYLEKIGQKDSFDNNLAEEIVNKLIPNSRKLPSSLEQLSMNDLINVFLHSDCWQYLKPIFHVEPGFIRNILNDVRITRNNLAHFKGEIKLQERDKLGFCKNWLKRHMEALNVSQQFQSSIVSSNGEDIPVTPIVLEQVVAQSIPSESLDSSSKARKSKYDKIGTFLRSQPDDKTVIKLSFSDLETIIGSPLPYSAKTYYAAWSNNRSHTLARQWLQVGWRTKTSSINQEFVVFERIKETTDA